MDRDRRASERRLNSLLGRILSAELSLRTLSQDIINIPNPREPDVMVYINGLRVIIEGSHEERDAEEDAKKRLREGLADVAIALYYKERYPRGLTDRDLEERLRGSKFDIKIFVPAEQEPTLEDFIKGSMPSKYAVKSITGWIVDIDVPSLASLLMDIAGLVIKEKDIKVDIESVENAINDFVKVLQSVDPNLNVAKSLYDVYYQLYGLSVGDYREIAELIYAQAALTILMASTFYSSIYMQHSLESLKKLIDERGPKDGLREAFERILSVDYREVYRIALEVLDRMPPQMGPMLEKIVDLAERISSKRSIFRRDFAGKVYHKVVGDWALRKGFATFYTSVPAAYLLAYLTVLDWNIDPLSVKAVDFACGSGTLLVALYNALRDEYARRLFGAGQPISFEAFHKQILEKNIYGLDVLKYAVHVASTNLVLQNPEATLNDMRMYHIPLGINGNRVYLGSLELLRAFETANSTTLMRFMGVDLSKVGEKASVIDVQGVGDLLKPPAFDIVIMNPPFTRPTGRGGRAGGGMFGFIAEESVREKIKEDYDRLRKAVNTNLRQLCGIYCEPYRRDRGLTPLFNIGQAGEGLLFLYLANLHVKEGGKIAFVLPKSFLSGVSWFLARTLILNKYDLEYVVVSYDGEKGYNFSESTSLSETLIVARKRAKGEMSGGKTTFVILLRKPETSLEARALAYRVARIGRDEGYVQVNSSAAYIHKVGRDLLERHAVNWGRLAAFPSIRLIKMGIDALEGRIFNSMIPMIELGRIAELGIDAHQFHGCFEVIGRRAPDLLPIVHGGEEEHRMRMAINPNAYAEPKEDKCREVYRRYASRLLVPDRIWVDTAHVIALYSSQPVLSNIFYAVKLRGYENDENRHKALALWLNTTWGILTILANRSETRGMWIRLKLTHWRLQPVLNVAKLGESVVKRLAEVFDRHSNKVPGRIPEQFGAKPSVARVEIDRDFLEALGIRASDRELMELYNSLGESLRTWRGEESEED